MSQYVSMILSLIDGEWLIIAPRAPAAIVIRNNNIRILV